MGTRHDEAGQEGAHRHLPVDHRPEAGNGHPGREHGHGGEALWQFPQYGWVQRGIFLPGKPRCPATLTHLSQQDGGSPVLFPPTAFLRTDHPPGLPLLQHAEPAHQPDLPQLRQPTDGRGPCQGVLCLQHQQGEWHRIPRRLSLWQRLLQLVAELGLQLQPLWLLPGGTLRDASLDGLRAPEECRERWYRG